MAEHYPGSPVRAGSDDAASVRLIQNRLNALKIPAGAGQPPLEDDGVFGPSTEAAVKLFQAQSTSHDGQVLDVDGVVGPMSWAALFSTAPVASVPPGDGLAAKAIAVAQSQVGVREVPLGSNRGPQVDLYLRACGIDPKSGSYAWCVAFIYYCFDQAATQLGVTNPLPKTAGVHDMWNQLGTRHHLRLAPSQASSNPQLVKPGMLFFIDAGGGLGHAGIVKAITGTMLDTIEGNTTDIAGSREGIGVFERNSRRIASINLGFADPIV